MTFPLMPNPATFIRPAPTVSYIGRNTTTGDGFPVGAQTFTSGLKIIVVCCEPAGISAASGVTVGGLAMIEAAQTGAALLRSASVWYLETTLSGSQTISGSGGTGRSSLDVYEVRGYSSYTPYFTGTARNDGSTNGTSISVPTPTNTLVIGSGTGGFTTITIGVDKGPAAIVQQTALESATSHFSWTQTPTERGPTLYSATGGINSAYAIALAAWK
jgi:hypothetical protein